MPSIYVICCCVPGGVFDFYAHPDVYGTTDWYETFLCMTPVVYPEGEDPETFDSAASDAAWQIDCDEPYTTEKQISLTWMETTYERVATLGTFELGEEHETEIEITVWDAESKMEIWHQFPSTDDIWPANPTKFAAQTFKGLFTGSAGLPYYSTEVGFITGIPAADDGSYSDFSDEPISQIISPALGEGFDYSHSAGASAHVSFGHHRSIDDQIAVVRFGVFIDDVADLDYDAMALYSDGSETAEYGTADYLDWFEYEVGQSLYDAITDYSACASDATIDSMNDHDATLSRIRLVSRWDMRYGFAVTPSRYHWVRNTYNCDASGDEDGHNGDMNGLVEVTETIDISYGLITWPSADATPVLGPVGGNVFTNTVTADRYVRHNTIDKLVTEGLEIIYSGPDYACTPLGRIFVAADVLRADADGEVWVCNFWSFSQDITIVQVAGTTTALPNDDPSCSYEEHGTNQEMLLHLRLSSDSSYFQQEIWRADELEWITCVTMVMQAETSSGLTGRHAAYVMRDYYVMPTSGDAGAWLVHKLILTGVDGTDVWEFNDEELVGGVPPTIIATSDRYLYATGLHRRWYYGEGNPVIDDDTTFNAFRISLQVNSHDEPYRLQPWVEDEGTAGIPNPVPAGLAAHDAESKDCLKNSNRNMLSPELLIYMPDGSNPSPQVNDGPLTIDEINLDTGSIVLTPSHRSTHNLGDPAAGDTYTVKVTNNSDAVMDVAIFYDGNLFTGAFTPVTATLQPFPTAGYSQDFTIDADIDSSGAPRVGYIKISHQGDNPNPYRITITADEIT